MGRQEEEGGGKRVCSFKSLPGRAQHARLPDDRAVATPAPCRHLKESGGRARGGAGRAGGEERGLCHPLVGAAGLAPSGGPSQLWEAASDWSGLGPSWRLPRPPSPLSSCRSVTGAAATLPRSPGVRAGAIPSWERRAGREGGRGRLRAPLGGASGAAAWREACRGWARVEGARRAGASRPARVSSPSPGVCVCGGGVRRGRAAAAGWRRGGRRGGGPGCGPASARPAGGDAPRLRSRGEVRGSGRSVRRYWPAREKPSPGRG